MAKVLLVEDDVNLREIYAARLQSEGYETITADDGESALAVAVKEKPDLIILDVMMPKISGFDVLDILRSTPETKNAKIMMMTALSQDGDKERGEKLGANRYLVKSQVTLEDMVENVKQLLEEGGVAAPVAAPVQPTPVTDVAPPQPQAEAPAAAAAAPAPVQPPAPEAPAPVAEQPAPQPQTEAVEPAVAEPQPVAEPAASPEPVAAEAPVVEQPQTSPQVTAADANEPVAVEQPVEAPVAAPVQPTPVTDVAPTQPVEAPAPVAEQPAPVQAAEPATPPQLEPQQTEDIASSHVAEVTLQDNEISNAAISTPGTVIQPTTPPSNDN